MLGFGWSSQSLPTPSSLPEVQSVRVSVQEGETTIPRVLWSRDVGLCSPG